MQNAFTVQVFPANQGLFLSWKNDRKLIKNCNFPSELWDAAPNPTHCHQQDHASSFWSWTPLVRAHLPLQTCHWTTSFVPFWPMARKILLTDNYCQPRQSYQSPKWNFTLTLLKARWIEK